MNEPQALRLKRVNSTQRRAASWFFVADDARRLAVAVGAIISGLSAGWLGGRRRAEDVGAQFVTRDAAGCFDGQNVFGRHPALAVDPSPHMTLPDGLFVSGKESGQSALASDRCYCGFER